MKTHGNLWVWGSKRTSSLSGVTAKYEKCRLQMHISHFHSEWFSIHLHYSNRYGKMDFSAIPANPLCIVLVINKPLCKHRDGDGGSGAFWWCRGLDYQIKQSWREYPLLKYLWARHCDDLSMAAASSSSVGICRNLPCVSALCNPSQCIRLSKATAETCLMK